MRMQLSNINLSDQLFYPHLVQDEKARISVCGLGYVGVVTTGCLADLGHDIIGIDTDARKLKAVARGQSPISEPGLEQLLSAGVQKDKICVSTSLMKAVWDTDVTFVSVGTPTAEDGGCDMSAVMAVSRQMGIALQAKKTFHIIVMRCSVPPGTTLGLMRKILESESGKKMGEDFGLCFNPEFLREGTAIEDFHTPPKTVIGASDGKTAQIISDIYKPVDPDPIITSIEVAEMVKYVDNVWHATKVTFGNEVGRICKPMGVDSHQVMDIFVQDTKLNLSPYYLKPGFAYGGSCLPKEVRAVQHLARDLGVNCPLVESLGVSNWVQIEHAIDMTLDHEPENLAVLGLAFKPNTDDLRESPILQVMHHLSMQGIAMQAYDSCVVADERLEGQFAYIKHAQPELKHLIENLDNVLCDDPEAMLANADCVLIAQNTPEIAALVKKLPPEKTVIDLVRLFKTTTQSPNYFGIGW